MSDTNNATATTAPAAPEAAPVAPEAAPAATAAPAAPASTAPAPAAPAAPAPAPAASAAPAPAAPAAPAPAAPGPLDHARSVVNIVMACKGQDETLRKLAQQALQLETAELLQIKAQLDARERKTDTTKAASNWIAAEAIRRLHLQHAMPAKLMVGDHGVYAGTTEPGTYGVEFGFASKDGEEDIRRTGVFFGVRIEHLKPATDRRDLAVDC